MKDKTRETKALFLFSNGKKPIDVAIELDLSASEVHNMLEEFWALNDLHELALAYNEIRDLFTVISKVVSLFERTSYVK